MTIDKAWRKWNEFEYLDAGKTKEEFEKETGMKASGSYGAPYKRVSVLCRKLAKLKGVPYEWEVMDWCCKHKSYAKLMEEINSLT